MVLVEELEDELEQPAESPYDDKEEDENDEDEPRGTASSSASAESDMLGGSFQQLLQVATHIKSNQLEVRESRERWDRLKFFERNTILFQQQDAAVRYGLDAIGDEKQVDNSDVATRDRPLALATSISPVHSRRFPRALGLKDHAASVYRAGGSSNAVNASMLYQRAIGLFRWARKVSTKNGDEYEWNDLLSDQKDTAQEHCMKDEMSEKEKIERTAEVAASTKFSFPYPPPPLNAAEREQALQLVFTCLVNIAACEERCEQWRQAIDACQAALNMKMYFPLSDVRMESATDSDTKGSPSSPSSFPVTALTLKALYRCATAYDRLDEQEAAIALLRRACRLAPNDVRLSSYLRDIEDRARKQKVKDLTTFGGMFERGKLNIDEAADDGKTSDTQPTSAHQEDGGDGTVDESNQLPPSERLDQTKQFLSDYLTGFQELKKKATQKSAIGPGSSASLDEPAPPIPSSTFPVGPSPSPDALAAMYAEARDRFGLDLSDPLVQEELRRLQMAELNPNTACNPSNPSTRVTGKRAQRRHADGMNADLASSGWLGPLLFCLVFAILLRWMGIA